MNVQMLCTSLEDVCEQVDAVISEDSRTLEGAKDFHVNSHTQNTRVQETFPSRPAFFCVVTNATQLTVTIVSPKRLQNWFVLCPKAVP